MLCLNERLPRYALHISQLDPSSKAALGSTKAPTRCAPSDSESKSTPVCTCPCSVPNLSHRAPIHTLDAQAEATPPACHCVEPRVGS